MKRLGLLPASLASLLLLVVQIGFANGEGRFSGYVSGVTGVDAFDDVNVTLTKQGLLETARPDTGGQFEFRDLADGDYVVKVRKPGYKSSPAYPFRIRNGALFAEDSVGKEFVIEELSSDVFVFHWEEDRSTAGYEYQANVVKPREVEFLGESVNAFDNSAANKLRYDYNISLRDDNESVAWTAEHAYRLLRMMETIPQRKQNGWMNPDLPETRWFIDSEHVPNDIRINAGTGDIKMIRLAEDAFVNASPRTARVDGKRGVYYSQRLHHALVRFVTDNGRNESAYERILQQRYGLTTRIESYEELTASTTNEPAWRFQEFHSEEIVQLINTLEEMPVGMHKVDGLRFLVRRLNGTPNPVNRSAPAIAWTGAGYIEFMDKAFDTSSLLSIHRLIIHEKSHFLWEYLFEDQLKRDWGELGGWHSDPTTASGWATTKQTEFVSAYAHSENPDEDMAESIAYFVINPRKLRSRSPGKYDFIRDRIMQGNLYISQIREDLTFVVYNLFPDYVYPGKIRRVDIVVEGAPREGKRIEIEIELHSLDHVLEGAKSAFLRIYSEASTYHDQYLYPVGVPYGEPGVVLAGSFELSQFAKAGLWRPRQIKIEDEHGNERLTGETDFGWSLLINSPMEDIIPPEYVPGSASLTKSTIQLEGREAQVIHAKWAVNENAAMQLDPGCYAAIRNDIPDNHGDSEYGWYNPERGLCEVDFIMPHYRPSATYNLVYIIMFDLAQNEGRTYFRIPGRTPGSRTVDEPAREVELITKNGDLEPPELDLNNIRVHAVPTNPDAPNGETVVTLTIRTRDNISGFRRARVHLRDPQGITRFVDISPGSTNGWFPEGDPSQWREYERTIILPVGSPPGVWGIPEIMLRDRAENSVHYDFTEIIHFMVE